MKMWLRINIIVGIIEIVNKVSSVKDFNIIVSVIFIVGNVF